MHMAPSPGSRRGLLAPRPALRLRAGSFLGGAEPRAPAVAVKPVLCAREPHNGTEKYATWRGTQDSTEGVAQDRQDVDTQGHHTKNLGGGETGSWGQGTLREGPIAGRG